MLFNKWCWENGTAPCLKKRRELDHSLTLTKISSKWIKAPTVRPDTIKLLEGNINRTLSDINQSNIFFQSVSQNNGNKNKDEHMVPT